MVIRDVTRERDVERHIQQQERLAAVGQLAAGIAHDFNNIMATIVLYAQMVARSEKISARDRERMETIDGQAKHATRLIQQILDFSRRAVLERRPLDLLPLLKEQTRLLERTLPESIEIELVYGPDECIVNADPTRMQQMVTNLAVNARDAMPEGGVLRFELERIRIEEGEAVPLHEVGVGEWVQMTVSDTGIGVRPDDLPHIFEPFFTTKEPGRGSGLGLAQVHGIVGAHEGHIGVESQTGQGTTFTIYLPLHLLDLPPATSANELPALVRGQSEIVLVVEDSVSTRKAIVESLELLNYRVLEATNGQEALEVLEEHGEEIALVLSDVVMPGMGGIALLHALKERGLAVQVVMLTGHPLESELEDLRAQGMIDWLPKPPGLEQLAKMVARALGKDSGTAGNLTVTDL
jgi:nitrogen-specific signal transduction histidine kinase/ActR/RegA family two-component response regulator